MVILDICFSLLIICSSKGSPCLLGEPAADQRPPLQFSFVSDWERLVYNRWPQRFKSDQETDFWWRNPGAEQARTGFWEALKLMELILHLYCSCVSVYSVTVRSCSIRTKRVGLVWLFCFLFFVFTWSIGNQRFSVGLVDQLFQLTRKPAEMVEKKQNKTVGVWRPLSPGIRPCIQLFQLKTIEICVRVS